MFIFRRTIVLTQHLVSSLTLGDCSVHRLREDSHNLCTEQSPKESDDTRCCVNTIDFLKKRIILDYLLNYLLTYLRTYSMVQRLLEKLTGLQLVKK